MLLKEGVDSIENYWIIFEVKFVINRLIELNIFNFNWILIEVN